jgi:glycosyltransferase involved in cell wall biosynthesis
MQSTSIYKVLILIPVYKRPEVFAICAKSLLWFKTKVKSWQIEVVCVLSPEDKYLKENEKTAKKYGFKAVYYKNLPVSDKMNAALEYIATHLEFDYLMNFGSDDLIHPDIEMLYEPYLKQKCRLFGVNTLYFTELCSKKTIHFDTYATHGSIGAGRMIHCSILEHFHRDQYPMYEPGLDCGLDTSSAMTIKRVLQIPDVVIESGKYPYIVDIKTTTNINQFFEIESRKECITESNYQYLKQFYPVL